MGPDTEYVVENEQRVREHLKWRHDMKRCNLEETDEGIKLCRVNHEKHDPCKWEYFVPAGAVDAEREALVALAAKQSTTMPSVEEEQACNDTWDRIPIEERPTTACREEWLAAIAFFRKGFRAALAYVNPPKEGATHRPYPALQITEKSGAVHKYVNAETHTYYVEYNDSAVTVSREETDTPGKYPVAVFYSPSSVMAVSG